MGCSFVLIFLLEYFIILDFIWDRGVKNFLFEVGELGFIREFIIGDWEILVIKGWEGEYGKEFDNIGGVMGVE